MTTPTPNNLQVLLSRLLSLEQKYSQHVARLEQEIANLKTNINNILAASGQVDEKVSKRLEELEHCLFIEFEKIDIKEEEIKK